MCAQCRAEVACERGMHSAAQQHASHCVCAIQCANTQAPDSVPRLRIFSTVDLVFVGICLPAAPVLRQCTTARVNHSPDAMSGDG